jgi:hypothetical protein
LTSISHRLKQPRFVLFAIIPAASLTFVLGLVIASIFFYAGRSITLRDAVISNLDSPFENAHGYLAAAVGTAIAALLMTPVVRLFFVGFGRAQRRLASIGAGLMYLGLAEAIAIGCMAPFADIYSALHIGLAFGTFIALCAGLAIFLSVVAWSTKGRAVISLALLQWAALSVMAYMLFRPGFPPDRSFLTSLALLEWALCLVVVVSIAVLTAVLASAA